MGKGKKNNPPAGGGGDRNAAAGGGSGGGAQQQRQQGGGGPQQQQQQHGGGQQQRQQGGGGQQHQQGGGQQQRQQGGGGPQHQQQGGGGPQHHQQQGGAQQQRQQGGGGPQHHHQQQGGAQQQRQQGGGGPQHHHQQQGGAQQHQQQGGGGPQHHQQQGGAQQQRQQGGGGPQHHHQQQGGAQQHQQQGGGGPQHHQQQGGAQQQRQQGGGGPQHHHQQQGGAQQHQQQGGGGPQHHQQQGGAQQQRQQGGGGPQHHHQQQGGAQQHQQQGGGGPQHHQQQGGAQQQRQQGGGGPQHHHQQQGGAQQHQQQGGGGPQHHQQQGGAQQQRQQGGGGPQHHHQQQGGAQQHQQQGGGGPQHHQQQGGAQQQRQQGGGGPQHHHQQQGGAQQHQQQGGGGPQHHQKQQGGAQQQRQQGGGGPQHQQLQGGAQQHQQQGGGGPQHQQQQQQGRAQHQPQQGGGAPQQQQPQQGGAAPQQQQQQPIQPQPVAAVTGAGDGVANIAVAMSGNSVAAQQSQPDQAKQPQAGKSRNKYKKAAEPAAPPVAAAVAAPDAAAGGDVPHQRSASVASSTGSAASAAAASVASGMSQVAIPTAASMALAPCKGPGSSGRHIQLDVNYLALNISKLVAGIHHYDVSIEPNMPKRFMPHVFEKFREANFPNIRLAFDGQKNAYAPQQLKLPTGMLTKTLQFRDKDEVKERAYIVTIKELKGGQGCIDMRALQTYTKTRQYDAPARALQAIEVVLKSVFLNAVGVGVGRSFFKPLIDSQTRRRVDLGDGFDLWTGLFQSTVLGAQPYLNVDIAHKAFPRPQPLLDMLQLVRGDPARQLDRRTVDSLQQMVRGLRINFQRGTDAATLRGYKFVEFGATAAQHRFTDDAGAQLSVEEYFKRKHRLALRYPWLPCVRVHPVEKGVMLPFEFCAVADNQAVMRRCTEMQTRNMIRHAATSTDVRKSKIMGLLAEIKHNASPTLQQFGVSVDPNFTTVKARVLQAPTLQYAGERMAQVARGVWNPSGAFINPMQLQRWAVMVCDQRMQPRPVADMVAMLVRIGANSFNMQINPEPEMVRLPYNYRDADIDACMMRLKEAKCQLLVCVIASFGDAYAKVKQAAEIRCGILTQCVKDKTVTMKGNDQSTISNILLKVNAKLNGVNHKCAKQSQVQKIVAGGPYMVIGADVTHPSPDQTQIPSVVGVAASHDPSAFRYRMCWRLQGPREEMIADLEGIMAEQLQLFRATNKVLPKTLLYYRDGVSDGQFQEVLRVELQAMYRAAQSVEANYRPKIVFVVVQKRHHTRFFPKQRMSDRNNNVDAGTIVDTQITHPNETQFFLVSHASIQGVAKPTKYCLLRDDLQMSMDDLETFTYNLCHMFTRCNRSVSYPAPTYYAHLAAYRGRVYIEGSRLLNMKNLPQEYNSRRTNTAIVNGNPMYFV